MLESSGRLPPRIARDASGRIVLRVGVSPAGTARFGYLGSLVLIRRS